MAILKKTITGRVSIGIDGGICHSSKPGMEIKIHDNDEIEGLTDASRAVIEELDLNNSSEIEARRLAKTFKETIDAIPEYQKNRATFLGTR